MCYIISVGKGSRKLLKGEKMLELSRGNTKLSNNVLIMNMGTADECPSRKRGLCAVEGICYAMKAERVYKQVTPFRKRQAEYWLNNSAEQIATDFENYLKGKRGIEYLRINEAGDFYSQDCVSKLNYLAGRLKKLGITTYGYTARKDLDFSNVNNVIIRGSGFECVSGATNVIGKNEDAPSGYKVCPNPKKGCGTKCRMCMKQGNNVSFRSH